MLPLIPAIAIAAFRAVRVVQLVSRLPAAMRAMSTLGRGAMRIGGQTLGRAGSSAGSVGGRTLGAGGARGGAAAATGATSGGGAVAAGGVRGLATRALERVAIRSASGSVTGSSESGRDSPQSRTESSDSGSDNVEISQSHILNETRNSPPNHSDTHSSRVDIDSLTRNYEVIGGLLNELLQNQNRNGGGGDRNNQSPIDIQPFIQELRESRIIAQRTLDQNREDAAAREARSAREEARESNERSEKKGYMSSLLAHMSKKTKSVVSSATGEVKKLSLLDYAGLAALGYSMLKKYFADTYEKISSFLTSAVSILSDPIGFIQEKFSDMATAISEKTKSVLGGIQEWYEQSDLKAFISDTFSTMTSMFDGLTSSITSLFKDWKLDEVWSKLTGWLDDVWGDTKKLASDAWSGTKSFFGFGDEDEAKKENRSSTPLFAPAPTATQSGEMADAAAIPPANNSSVGPSPFADPLLHTGTIGAAAKSGGMKGLDPRLQEIMDETAKEFPLRSRVVSATGGRTGAHGEGRAMDITLFDQNGVALPNYQNSENFRAYEMFAQAAFLKAKEKYPDLTDGEGKNFNWGGYFGDNGNGKYKYGSNDSMHYALDDNEKFRASGAQAANPLQGLQGEYRGWYDKGDLLGGSKKYDPETFAADMEKLKNFRLTEEQAARAKASYYGVAKASGTLEKIPEDPTNPDVAFDFESLDKDMKSAPLFAATGDANSMADTNQVLSDPSQMIAGFKPENPVMAQPVDEPTAKKQSITKLPNSIKGISHQEKFMKTVYEKAFKQTGDHETSLLLASQAAIETGYGKHAPNNNLFGVKSHGKSEGASLKTKEVINGKEVTQTANFREYESYDEAIADRLKFTEENPRYRKNGYFDAQTAKEKAEALQRAGYATDPNYASKIDSVAEKLRKIGYDGSNTQTTMNQPSTNQTTGRVPELSSGGVIAQSNTETKSDKLTDFEYTGKNIMNVMSRGTSSRVPFIFDKIDKGVSSKLHDFSSDIGAGSNLVSNLTSSIQNKITEGLMGGTEELQKVMNSAQRIAGNVNVVTPQTNAPSNSQYNSGTTSIGAPLVTRNTDSSIRRLTDSLLSYGLT